MKLNKYTFRKLVWLIALASIIFDSFIFISLPNLPMNIKLNSKFEEISMSANDFSEETDVKLEELEMRRKTESERALRRKKDLLSIREREKELEEEKRLEEEKKLEEEKVIYENSYPIEEPSNGLIVYETETTETYHENIEWYTIEVSYYCPCYICCGKEDGITASGNLAIEGVTVALPSSIPLGTIIVIDGHEYVCQDRGGAIIDYGNNYIRADIFLNSHEDCLARGRYITEGYIIWE